MVLSYLFPKQDSGYVIVECEGCRYGKVETQLCNEPPCTRRLPFFCIHELIIAQRCSISHCACQMWRFIYNIHQPHSAFLSTHILLLLGHYVSIVTKYLVIHCNLLVPCGPHPARVITLKLTWIVTLLWIPVGFTNKGDPEASKQFTPDVRKRIF